MKQLHETEKPGLSLTLNPVLGFRLSSSGLEGTDPFQHPLLLVAQVVLLQF